MGKEEEKVTIRRGGFLPVRFFALALLLIGACQPLFGQNKVEPEKSPPNLPIKTLGGTQLWSDLLVIHGWRIQRHALTEHHRLLDPKSIRRGWGTYAQCLDEFKKERETRKLSPQTGRAIVLLHGLGRTKHSMGSLGEFLDEESDDHIVKVSYASGRLSIGDHAANLGQVLENLKAEGITDVSFVAHSLGNLVIRYYLGLDEAQEKGKKLSRPALGRIVMLAPPNQGSRLAEIVQNNPMFQLLAGKSGQEIADFEKTKQRLATPKCDFGIIMGGKGKSSGRNPLLDGDDDMVVTVDEAKLVGSKDFLVIPATHTFIMNHPEAKTATLRFLQSGTFSEAK